MSLSIRFVESAYVNQTWPLVEKYLSDALELGGDFPDWADNYNLDHLQMFVTSGLWLLVVAVNEENKVCGACTVSFVNYPLHRVAFVTAIGGRFIANADCISQFKQLLKSHGATKIQGYGRGSIVRLWKRYNFQTRNVLFETLL